MTLVDTNVLMYATGGEHENKDRCSAFVDRLAEGEVEAVIDAETLQEILHRYRALGRWKEGSRIYTLVRRLFPEVLPVTVEVLDHTRGLMELYPRLSARDAIHAAVVQLHSLDSICSFDKDFDDIPGMLRIQP